MNAFKRLVFLVKLCAFAFCHAEHYQIEDLDLLSFGRSDATSINEQGDIGGIASNVGEFYVFVWTKPSGLKIVQEKKRMHQISFVNPQGVASGLVYKQSFFKDHLPQPFIWNEKDGFQDFAPIVPKVRNQEFILYTVGYDFWDFYNFYGYGYYLWKDGVITPVDNASEYIFDQDWVSLSLNNKKQMAVSTRKNNMKRNYLINLETGETKPFMNEYEGWMYVTSLNDHGDIGGYLRKDNCFESFIAKSDGQINFIPNFALEDLNDQCVAVGVIHLNNQKSGGIFLNNELRDINDLIIQNEDVLPLCNKITKLNGINNHGEMIGCVAVNGTSHAIRLTPVEK